ncbi:hypothetical protein HJB67_12815 [Rhizobium lentis]|uniref:hypothetical protein n=1 Tax=Rhizobium lentis TaxID=1138194 RepID=UPI001C8399DD|nr:hypothetical protein [Rhizobium lentis]MBX5010836.1 hypothetical protein [Rhizobium lentis]
MAISYVMTTYKGSRAYNYLRVPSHLVPFFGKKTFRLSDDRQAAEAEAARIISGLPSEHRSEHTEAEDAAARKMLANANGRSKKKGMDTDLSVEVIIDMMRKQGFRCAVTLLPFDLDWKKTSGAKRNAYAPSLDRVDNNKGYTKDNCRVVLAAVNYAMNEWGLDTYITIAEAAARHGTRTKFAN